MVMPITLTVTAVTDATVTAKMTNQQTIQLPREAVYGKPAVGQELKLIGVVAGSEDAGETAFARRLLNQLMGSSA